MPKRKPTVDEWIRDYKELNYQSGKLFCRACVKMIQCEKKYNIIQHLKTTLHKECLKKFTNKSKQSTIGESLASTGQNEQREFYFDLCKAMVQSNIPLNKLKNTNFKTFLEKYCKLHIPEESTLRKNYVSLVYNETIHEIKELIGSNYIWFTVDETTDVCGRYIANLIIGVLNEDVPTTGYLICSKELDATNNNTVSRFINEALINFYLPESVPSDKILLMLSDAAAYMVKTASNLKVFYGNLIHCTCLAHGLNRVAETIRQQFPLVNELIKNGKKVFIKAPLRVQLFKEQLPNTPLPPEPVLTRWGTWLDAALYYADNFENFKKIIFELPEAASKSIKDCQVVLIEKELKNNLAFIKSNLSFVSKTIKLLEKQQMLLVSSIKTINNFEDAIDNIPGPTGQILKNKLKDVLSKNEGFQKLKTIAMVLEGSIVSDLKMHPALMAKFKHAPITSVDVERSFSAYKNILSDRRQSFTTENLNQHLVIASFYRN
ncbi:unnamed protein product [Brassicogethes aeneus]|uniref:DUF659 domain-containing protein n=1 Tax=Brassicogethes aeneus TaxID=1431903 RepID=A0A9P0BIJ4_BRAAE|nr:unnamed protein product [Brassicogethes aeneus]